jgi:hypothetical protein
MSNVLKSYHESLMDKGKRRGVVSFVLFFIFWLLGYVFGYVMVLLGYPVGDLVGYGGKIDGEMVRKMNDMGPSN